MNPDLQSLNLGSREHNWSHPEGPWKPRPFDVTVGGPWGLPVDCHLPDSCLEVTCHLLLPLRPLFQDGTSLCSRGPVTANKNLTQAMKKERRKEGKENPVHLVTIRFIYTDQSRIKRVNLVRTIKCSFRHFRGIG